MCNRDLQTLGTPNSLERELTVYTVKPKSHQLAMDATTIFPFLPHEIPEFLNPEPTAMHLHLKKLGQRQGTNSDLELKSQSSCGVMWTYHGLCILKSPANTAHGAQMVQT